MTQFATYYGAHGGGPLVHIAHNSYKIDITQKDNFASKGFNN